jgi:hypothetical protein
MTSNAEKILIARLRRRQLLFDVGSKIIGCAALVVTIAVVFYVVIVQLDRQGPKIDPIYLEEELASTDAPNEHFEESATETTSENSNGGAKSYHLGLPRPQTEPTQNPIRSSESVTQTSTTENISTAANLRHQTDEETQGLRDMPSSLSRALPGPQTRDLETSIASLDQKRLEIEATVRHFFSAKTVTEKASCSRDSQRVKALMEKYYKDHPISSGQWRGLGWVMAMQEPGHKLAYAESLFADSDPICIIIEEAADGKIYIDWESSVRYCELGWNDFQERKPDNPTLFRVLASKPRSSMLPVEKRPSEEVIELKHPGEQGTVYAYFNRDDPQFQLLVDQMQQGEWSNVPVTLKLCYPGPTTHNHRGPTAAVRIASVEGKGWLILQHRRS